jgi:hypothetical protein
VFSSGGSGALRARGAGRATETPSAAYDPSSAVGPQWVAPAIAIADRGHPHLRAVCRREYELRALGTEHEVELVLDLDPDRPEMREMASTHVDTDEEGMARHP